MNKDDLIGLTIQEIKEKYPDIDFRVTREDNIRYLGTADLKLDRYNLHVNDGKVTAVNMG